MFIKYFPATRQRYFDLTKTRSATATGGERQSKWKCFNHGKRDCAAGSRSLHRMVRRCGHWSERCRNSVRYREASASALALSVLACQKDRIGVSRQTNVRQVLIFVRSCKRQPSLEVIGRNGRGFGWHSS